MQVLLCFLLNLLFNEVDFLQDNLRVLFELVNFLAHYVNEACAFLVRYAQETDVVLICRDFVLECLILADEMVTFTLQVVSTLADIVSEAIELALVGFNVELLVDGVEYGFVLLVNLVLLLEWNEAYCIPFCGKCRYLFVLFCRRQVGIFIKNLLGPEFRFPDL